MGGFLAFPPDLITIRDEVAYVQQALAFSRGEAREEVVDPLTGERSRQPPSDYPAGTSALQSLFVRIGGWRAATWASLTGLLILVLVVGRWLEEEGRPPVLSLLVLGYPPLLALGRTAMSDLPSGAMVALGLWLWWRARSAPGWLAAGLVASASLVFRETNGLVFLPFFVGMAARREAGAAPLLAGAAAGLPLKLASSHWLFGHALFVRQTGGFTWDALLRNGPLYLFALMVMVPGGLLAVLLYRGRRRPELIATVVLSFLVFGAYNYGAELSAGLKRLVLGPRYFIPLLPLVVWSVSEVLHRAGWPAAGGRTGRLLLRCWTGTVLAAAVAVHPLMWHWSQEQRPIREALYAYTQPSALVITNPIATAKFLNPLYGPRLTLPLFETRPQQVPALLQRHGAVQMAFLDRFDGPGFTGPGGLAGENAVFVLNVSRRCRVQLLYDAVHPAGRLRIWDVQSCPP